MNIQQLKKKATAIIQYSVSVESLIFFTPKLDMAIDLIVSSALLLEVSLAKLPLVL